MSFRSRLLACLLSLALVAQPVQALDEGTYFRLNGLKGSVMLSAPDLETTSPDGITVTLFDDSFSRVVNTLAAGVPSPSVAGATAPLAWSLQSGSLPPGLSLNSSAGTIGGTPTTVGTWSGIRLHLIDGEGKQADSAAFAITITPADIGGGEEEDEIVIANVPTPIQGRRNEALTGPTPTLTNAVAPVTWSVPSNNLPAGLSINASTGQITGTPSVSGSFPGVILRVQDAANKVATFTTQINLASHLSIGNVSPVVIMPLSEGGRIEPVLYGRLGSGQNWSQTGLPPGMSFNSVSGYITGIPTNWGDYNLALTASDGFGSVTLNFQIKVPMPLGGGSQTWAASGTFTPPKVPLTVRVLTIGGGAGGCGSHIIKKEWACGGASGEVKVGTFTITQPGPITVSVGAGGTSGSLTQAGVRPLNQRGGSSSFGSFLTSLGGQYGDVGGRPGSTEANPTPSDYVNVDFTMFTHHSVTAGLRGDALSSVTPGEVCDISGTMTPLQFVRMGGAGGIMIAGRDDLAQTQTTASNGSIRWRTGNTYQLGTRGRGYGAGGGGGYGNNCYALSDAKAGAGHSGYVLVEWDAQ